MSFYDECIKQRRFDLLRQWDTDKNLPLTPKTITAWNKNKVHWICEKGHSWEISTQNRLRHDSGCPVCSYRTIIPGVNDAETMYPELKKYWSTKLNKIHFNKLSAAHSYRLKWKCRKGHIWSATLKDMSNHNSCPVCMGISENTKFVSFAEKNPDLLKEWNYEKNTDIDPNKISAYSHKKAWWKCEKGHEWNAQIKSRTYGCGCPVCTNKVLLPGTNDLLTVCPDIKEYWDYEKNGDLKPEMFLPGNKTDIWWRCKEGHSFRNQIATQARNMKSCPYCSGRLPIPGETDLQTLYPQIASEWDYDKNFPLKPSEVTAFSNRKVWWKCEKGHEYYSLVSGRTAAQSGCPYCSGQKILSGFNDLKTLKPKIAAEWCYEKNGDLKPEMVSPGSRKNVWWICSKGHEYESKIESRTVNDTGCPYCAGRKILVGFNDLQTTEPEIAKEWFRELNGGLTPEMVTKGSGKKVWWKCSFGHVWKVAIAHRTARNTGCPVCSGYFHNSTLLDEQEVEEMLKKLKEKE